MRVFLAGDLDLLGTPLVSLLTAAGHEVARPTSDVPLASRSAYLASIGDLKADAVISLIGVQGELPEHYRAMRAVNRARAEGTSTLLAAARRMGATRVVGASSFHGYGFRSHGTGTLDETLPFGLTDESRNDSVQKALLTAEQQVRAFGGIALRFGHLWGPEHTDVPAIPTRFRGDLPVVHTSDAVRAIVAALTAGESGAAYNIVSNDRTNWAGLQRARASQLGHAAPVELPDGVIRILAPFAAQVITGTSLRLSNNRAASELNWLPQVSVGGAA